MVAVVVVAAVAVVVADAGSGASGCVCPGRPGRRRAQRPGHDGSPNCSCARERGGGLCLVAVRRLCAPYLAYVRTYTAPAVSGGGVAAAVGQHLCAAAVAAAVTVIRLRILCL